MIDHVISNGRRTAQFYDQLTPPESFPLEAAEWLVGVIGPHRRSILELGVGTGRVLSRVSEVMQQRNNPELTNCRLHGVDISQEMIEQAKLKPTLSEAQFTVGDVRSVRLNEKFSTVLCLGNTLGMSLEESALGEICTTAISHLEDDGIFVVDFQNPATLDALFVESSVVSSFEQQPGQPSGVVQFFIRPNKELFRINQHWIEGEEVTSFVEEILLYSMEQVQRAAEAVGLNLVGAYGDYVGSTLMESSSFMNILVFDRTR